MDRCNNCKIMLESLLLIQNLFRQLKSPTSAMHHRPAADDEKYFVAKTLPLPAQPVVLSQIARTFQAQLDVLNPFLGHRMSSLETVLATLQGSIRFMLDQLCYECLVACMSCQVNTVKRYAERNPISAIKLPRQGVYT